MKYERNIIVELHRKKKVLWRQCYKSVDNAIPKATYHLMHTGNPGDIMEVSHAISGKWLGEVKIHAGGKITSKYVWDELTDYFASIKLRK